jgi:oligoendopeptidase F
MKSEKDTWDLTLLYKSEKDSKIEKDILKIEKAYSEFEKKYKNKDFTSTSKKLLEVLEEREKISKELENGAPWWYFALRKDLDSNDTVATSSAARISQRITKAENKKTFFRLELSSIPKTKQKKFLNDPLLAKYRYHLEKIFQNGEYLLSEGEEQLVSLLSQTSYSMWIDGQNKILSQQTIDFKGNKLLFSKALGELSEKPKAERQVLHKKINEVTRSISSFAESEINAVYNYKRILDDKRGFKKPYSSVLLSDQMDEKTIEGLVDLVTKNFKISRRFYKLHAKLLKERKVTMAERNVPIGEIKKKFYFPKSVEVVKRAFSKVDPKYADILEGFLKNRQIDVYPKKGKKGGAYSWGGGKLPTFVLLNHVDNVRSVETLAHEMGHAIHSAFSRNQPSYYRRYSTSVAEVASTFFEQVAASELESELTPEENMILLHNKIHGDITTIFRQIACFNFELELHREIREKGLLSKEKIADLMSKHLKSYLGEAVEVTHEDGYSFVNWMHIRRFFYVYSYAYGQLVSRALFENWKKDPTYSTKIEQFLSAGGSMSPRDIFRKIGIDTLNPKFFALGLKGIEKDIDRLEKLYKSVNSKKKK